MEVKKKKMEAKKGEGKGRRQKAVIGILAAVVIAVLFTVTIGIGMNNSDTGNGVVETGGLGDTITAYGNGGSNNKGILEQEGQIKLQRSKTQTIYEGTSGFFITITATGGNFNVYYMVGNLELTANRVSEGTSITLSYGHRPTVAVHTVEVRGVSDIAEGKYTIDTVGVARL